MDEHLMVIDDHYTGAVSQESAPQRRTITGGTITKISVGPMDNNAYLIVCSATGQSLLIDAANDATRLSQLIDENAPTLALIVTTHQHADHWQALEDIAGGTASPTAAHSLDAEPLPVAPDRLLADGDTVEVGELTLDVIHLSGHTPGSIALALTDSKSGVTHLFTGDSLFPGGVGKTSDPEHFTSLLNDVSTKLFDEYGDDTVVYPGHGKDTTLGAERPHLDEWRQRGW
ncbi:MBL fold metallo-hydrolase [Rhodococcus sp. BP-252]|uniref:MBL fold metallo-hydrolase n=1 Tax=Rhodococcoides kyotonense TaxID=398843 RepID=A0A177YR46_9NOCA|nr:MULTISPECIES: MBL fold metallo-hydrolase [Rhodococcus]MBY6411248.1 MBL fold metallo-hydrolase [Rhodococcus sp. BP-320]MBY6415907.1 MBL fold metallo-hydrolase [Rhodococcus sp. BP-321]MBY6420584.1 MBL fold metallo-hydrolase [Rhodococcus sp. BP-324]MBY6426114.1 MBL fold metallo-hydrolase [Rhodococcus sp. BP-323]MBY6431345.1 MBL fold metallo-hydrolase [Rhodococcus sp. BP-322]